MEDKEIDSVEREDVAKFLERIKEMGARHDREDAERTHKLEAELAASREARRIRRDERARSLSPQKDSPLGSPFYLRSFAAGPGDQSNNESPEAALDRLSGKLGPTDRAESTGRTTPDPSAAAPAPMLSWQRPRPKSLYGAMNNIPQLSPSMTGKSEGESSEMSRAHIAASLGSKEPSWLRQTRERAATAGGLQKPEPHSLEDVPRKALPGDNVQPVESLPFGARLSRSGSIHSNGFPPLATSGLYSGFRERSPSISSENSGKFTLEPLERSQPAMSPTQGRLSPEHMQRTSPTKGFGGFVQSAMLKREGSVNKRWSREVPGMPTRTNSTATVRHSYTKSDATAAMASREATPSTVTATEDTPSENAPSETTESGFKLRGRSKTTSGGDRPLGYGRRDASPPAIATKTFEPKRWSPTKSSWLETALKKGTDNPQPPMAPAKPVASMISKFSRPAAEETVEPAKPAPVPAPTSKTPRPMKSEGALKYAASKQAAAEQRAKESATTTTNEERPITANSEISNGSEISRPKTSNSVERPRTAAKEPEVLSVPHTPPAKMNSMASVAEKAAFLNRTSSVLSTASAGSSRYGSAAASPNTSPTKATSATIDFRAALKPRPVADKEEEKEEIPFLNALQRLRSTRQQKSQAQDELKELELKEIILEGKSKLASTGGPQKSLAVDPLKATILSAKVALKPSETSPTRPNFSPTDPKLPLPPSEKTEPKLPTQQPVLEKTMPLDLSPFEKKAPAAEPKIISRAPLPAQEKIATEPKAIQPLSEKLPAEPKPAPSPFERKVPSLAGRVNPGLANLLSRGPPVAASGNTFRSNAESLPTKASKEEHLDESSASAGAAQLTHITKGRARGPKRKAPSSAAPAVAGAAKATPERPTPRVAQPATLETPAKPARAASRSPSPSPAFKPEVPRKLSAASLTPRKTSISSTTTSELAAELSRKISHSSLSSEKSKPATPAKSPMLRGSSFSSITGPPSIQEEYIKSSPPPASKASSVLTRETSFASLSSVSTGKLEDVSEARRTTSASPIVLPKRGSDRGGIELPGFAPVQAREAVEGQPRVFSRTVNPLPEGVEATIETPSTSTADSKLRMLSTFFRGPSHRAVKMDFDMMSILSSSPVASNERAKTISFELQEITGNGKLSPIAKEEQHIFFEDSMYLGVHTFEHTSGANATEVYLWSGVNVPASSNDDAQIFARKTARENDAKLISLQQGRESGEFFEAIGGILITRRGSHEKTATDASYMLCGRKCFGGFAFDEVDLKVLSLASGFPFIVRHQGAVFLWKGKGATPEEIGVARLVGVEISGGEVKECAEGDEPDNFFTDALSVPEEKLEKSRRVKSANYWAQKPSCKKYSARLFKIDLQSAAKVVEISPFCQMDLDPSEIYVTDAFFEFYIIVGSQSQSKREEFQAALQFTEAYALFAAQEENRPSIPLISVVIGGAPREFKILFRHWDDNKTPTAWTPARKPSLRVLELEQAKQAVDF
ncbi:hypothetical protein FPQ18DRAFT_394942 [Pyronema domesticum]|nr:hypothetical protein FPQ18DRAFT_394942 [Pyronema domesticum]